MTIDKNPLSGALRSPKTKKYGWRVLFAIVAVGVIGFFVLPPIVKSVLRDQLGQVLHRPVTVERVSINPYNLSFQIDGLAVQEKDGEATVAGFDRLYVNLEAISLLRGGAVVSEIRLEGPKLRVVRLADKRYNFSDLIDAFLARPETDSPTPPFSLNNIQISGGTLEFDDRPVDEKHVVSDIALTLPFVSSLSYAVETFVEPAFSAKIDGAPLVLKGRSKPFAGSHESELVLDLNDLQLAKYLDYAPVPLPVKMVSGALDSDLKLVFRQGNGQPSTLNLSGSAALKGLVVNEATGAPLLSLKRLDLVLGSADLLRRKFVLDRVVLDTPEIHARADKQGRINWLELLPKPVAAQETPAGKAATPAAPVEWQLGEASIGGGALRWLDESHGKAQQVSIEGFDFNLKKLASPGATPAEFDLAWRLNAKEWLQVDAFSVKGGRLDLGKREVVLGEVLTRGTRILGRRAADGTLEFLQPPALRSTAQAVQEDSAPPWKVTVGKLRSEDIGLRFEDRSMSPRATHDIEGMSIEAENLSSEPGQTSSVATRFKFNRKGDVDVSGKMQMSPLNADLKFNVKTLQLLPLQPYFTDKLNIAVTRGQLTLAGDLQLRQAASGKEQGLSGGFSGQATIGDFFAVDKINSADFLKWKSFYLGKVDVRLNPDSVSIGEVALADFFARVILSPEGKLNLTQIVRKDEKAIAETPETPAPALPAATHPAPGKAEVPLAATATKPVLPVRIGKVTLQGGSVNFTDNFIKPNYSANLRQIGGSVSSLSSAADTVANIELRGSYDDVAPLNISGRFNPLSAKPYLDLQAEVKGIEMTSFSPYSGKYAGYAIEKGKLSVFVKYKIENNQLQAENRVFLDQLTFGQPVESPDATKLPVNLALALLKNRKGEIDIDLPISGSLDDPQFSIGGLIVKVIVNLLVKAVTSPFALIGSLFGGGEEMSFVEFDYGLHAIPPAAKQRLENLARALVDRPSLKLEIDGRVDVERDREGLKRALIDNKVRALKRDDLTKKDVESGPVEEIEVTTREYPALLERVYRAEKFPKPRNMIGLTKELPVEEMEKLILTNTSIGEEDLRALATRRAQGVRDWLLRREVPSERIFLLPARLGAVDAKAGASEKARESRVDFSLK